MKLLGAALIWSICVVMGYSASRRYVRRKELYEDFVLLIECIKNDVQYFLKPISESMLNNKEYIDNGVYGKLITNLENGIDFPASWQKAINDSDLPVTAGEKKKIISFIDSLGKSDFEVQKNILSSYKDYFIKMQEKSDKSCEKYSLTILMSSILCGGAMFLMLI